MQKLATKSRMTCDADTPLESCQLTATLPGMVLTLVQPRMPVADCSITDMAVDQQLKSKGKLSLECYWQ